MIINPPVKLLSRTSIDAKCDICGSSGKTLYSCYKRSLKKHDGLYLCYHCAVKKNADRMRGRKTPQHTKQKLSKKIKEISKTSDYRSKVSNGVKKSMTVERIKKISDKSKELWNKKEYRDKIEPKLKQLWNDEDIKEKAIKNIKKHSGRISKLMKGKWANDKEYRQKVLTSMGRMNTVSSLQKIVYSIFDDYAVKYEKEYVLGYFRFDCMVPDVLEGGKSLLIECQGEYWHNQKDRKIRDKQKATYIGRYCSDKFLLKTIWEHEFKRNGFVKNKLLQWCGINQTENFDFDFNDINFKKIDINVANVFCGKYHYFANAGRSGLFYGAFMGGKLVAVSAFAGITRKESINFTDFKTNEVKELTRFCIADGYHKNNFASWLLSKLIKATGVKMIITYADETYGHSGIIYKSCNWQYVSEVKPDYFYRNKDNYVVHKKTLWDHAKKQGSTEKQYSIEHGYDKIMGLSKHKFCYYF